MTVPQMGRALAVSRQFVQRMVNEAAGGGLVEAIPNPAHQRSALIRLTDTGRTTIDDLIARESALMAERLVATVTGPARPSRQRARLTTPTWNNRPLSPSTY